MKNAVKILLADDHALVRAGIRSMLEGLPEIVVVGEANDGREALELVASLSPDLVFMDIAMPGLNGLDTRRASSVITRRCGWSSFPCT